MKQYEAVIRAMEDLGGYATLGQLYQKAFSYPDVEWGTKTPQASIRRIVQKRPEFFKIRPGLWGLRTHKREILRKLQIDEDAEPVQQESFDHTYYQGIVAEWGRLLQYLVHIPRQDRNKPFSGKPLHELSDIEDIPAFTYPQLVQRAGTVDVIWFSRAPVYRFPICMFEVEHTTDFHHSLIKFRHFVHFSVRFFVVAPIHRKREFQEKLERDHHDLRERVKFLDYEALVRLYVKDMERQAVYREVGMPPL